MIALRKWGSLRDEVTITLTGKPDDADMARLNAAVHAFSRALSSEAQSPSQDGAGAPVRAISAPDEPSSLSAEAQNVRLRAFVESFAKRDPVFAKGVDKQRIYEARSLLKDTSNEG